MNSLLISSTMAAIALLAAAAIGAPAPPPSAARASATPAVRTAFIDTPATATVLSTQPVPAPPFDPKAHGGFDPEKFGQLTTETLPLENGAPIVARVNGRPVPFSDFEIQARVLGADFIQRYPDRLTSIYAALKFPVMDALVTQELHREYAERNNLLPSPEETARHQQAMQKQRLPRIRQSLDMLTEQQELSLARDSLINEKVMKFVGDRATSTPPTLEEITSFTRFLKPTTSPVEMVRARHIVVRATSGASQFNVNDASAKADEILQRVRDGLDFETAARQYSQDRFTAYLGGNVGYFSRGMMFAEFEEAAFALKPGEVSQVIRTPVGFHIVQVTERHNDNLLYLVEQHKRAIAVHEWKVELLKSAEVENYLVE